MIRLTATTATERQNTHTHTHTHTRTHTHTQTHQRTRRITIKERSMSAGTNPELWGLGWEQAHHKGKLAVENTRQQQQQRQQQQRQQQQQQQPATEQQSCRNTCCGIHDVCICTYFDHDDALVELRVRHLRTVENARDQATQAVPAGSVRTYTCARRIITIK